MKAPLLVQSNIVCDLIYYFLPCFHFRMLNRTFIVLAVQGVLDGTESVSSFTSKDKNMASKLSKGKLD